MMNRRHFSILIILTMLLCLFSCSAAEPVVQTDGRVVIHFVDVGQGDCEFVELPEGKCMLIDAGERVQGDAVSNYIKKLGYTEITYLVATHPHSDHIGGLESVIGKFDIGTLYAPKVTTNTKTYERFLLAVKDKGLKITRAVSGTQIADYDGVNIKILSPAEDTPADDLNDMSAVISLECSGKKVLFSGDAGYDILKECASDIDVLKVSHHGSETGTDKELMNLLTPDYAIISCGASNSYNHPNADVVKLLKDTKLYRTDKSGTVIATVADGEISFNK